MPPLRHTVAFKKDVLWNFVGHVHLWKLGFMWFPKDYGFQRIVALKSLFLMVLLATILHKASTTTLSNQSTHTEDALALAQLALWLESPCSLAILTNFLTLAQDFG